MALASWEVQSERELLGEEVCGGILSQISLEVLVPNLQEAWVAGISVTLHTPYSISFWSSPFLGDCGWREGERQLESLQTFLKGCRWGRGD